LNRPSGSSLKLIKFVADRLGHDYRYAINASKIEKELGWKASTSFEIGLEKTLTFYLEKIKN
jgi:dTDP-glucose 4,6-dehydratase